MRTIRTLPCLLAVIGCLLIGWGGVVSPATAQSTIDVPMKDPAAEKQAKAIFKVLRCLVCQNQSIDDSNADLARDLRVLVRQRLKAGDSSEQAIRFIVDRYGDWVLLNPPFKATTLVLWIGPLIIFLFGAGWIVRRVRQRIKQTPVAAVPLSDDERQRLSSLLDDAPDQNGSGA